MSVVKMDTIWMMPTITITMGEVSDRSAIKLNVDNMYSQATGIPSVTLKTKPFQWDFIKNLQIWHFISLTLPSNPLHLPSIFQLQFAI